MHAPRIRPAGSPGTLMQLGVVMALSATSALAAGADPVTLDVTPRDAGADIALTWQYPAQAVSFRVEYNTLWLQFDRPLGTAPLHTLPERLPEWIEAVRFGYDTLLITAHRPVHYAVAGDGNTVTITLTAVPPQPESVPETSETTRIDRLRALALLEQGEPDAAEQLLEELAARVPDNAAIASDLARVAEARGDWRGALNGYRRAGGMDDGYEPALQAADRLWRLHGPRVGARTVVRDVRNADRQTVTTLDGQALWDQRNLVGVRVEDRHLEIADIRRASGVREAVNRHLVSGELWLGYNWGDGAESRLGLLFNPDGTGFRLSHHSGGTVANTDIEAIYHRPYFAYAEGVADDAVQDRLALRNFGPIGKRLRTSLGFSANRYWIAGMKAGNSGGMDAALHYEPAAGVTLSYTLDAEYVDNVTTLPAPGGGVFQPLPITDREVHAIGATLSRRPTGDLRWQAGGGYAWDRHNDSGAFASLQLAFSPAPGFELVARAARSVSMERGRGNHVYEYGVSLSWRPAMPTKGGTS